MTQPGVLLPPPIAGLHLRFTCTAPLTDALAAIAALPIDERVVVGLGPALADVPGLRAFPDLDGPEASAPATQSDLWVWVRADSPGDAYDRATAVVAALRGAFVVEDELPTFLFRGGRDLTDYEDGTENPSGEAAAEAVWVSDGPLAGSTFVAVQRWVHDLGVMARMSQAQRDHTIGRDQHSNEELADAPASAHVKRAAQESFDPPAFMLRRSMPWGGVREHGLLFVAFGQDLDRFERVLRRMLGLDDGVTDALFRYSRADAGGYYWCPPVVSGRLKIQVEGPG